MATAIDELIRELKNAETDAARAIYAACGRMREVANCLSQIKLGKGKWNPVGRVNLKRDRLYAVKRPGSSASVARWMGLASQGGDGWVNVVGEIPAHGITLLVWVPKD